MRKHFYLIGLSLFLSALIACNEDEDPEFAPEPPASVAPDDPRLPTIEQAWIFGIYPTRIGMQTAVTDDGGFFILEKGICWGLEANPTTEDSTSVPSHSVGAIYHDAEPLMPETEYYIRPFATNEIGTKYGNQFKVKTEAKGSASGTYKGQTWTMYEYQARGYNNSLVLFAVTSNQDSLDINLQYEDSQSEFPQYDSIISRGYYRLNGELFYFIDSIGNMAITQSENEKVSGNFVFHDSVQLSGTFEGLSHFNF